MIKIVWSDKKNRQNIRKHQVDFAEAGTIFDDPMQLTINDPTIRFTKNDLLHSDFQIKIVY